MSDAVTLYAACKACEFDNPEAACHRLEDLRITPDGEPYCDSCWDDSPYDQGSWIAAPTVASLYTRSIPTPPPAAEAGERIDFLSLLHGQMDWSFGTFGPGPRSAGNIDHIRKELLEIEAAPSDLEEWVDVAMLAIDGACREGYSPQQVIKQYAAKLTKNMARKWPDWRTADPSKAIEHDRSAASLLTTPSYQDGVEAAAKICEVRMAMAKRGGEDRHADICEALAAQIRSLIPSTAGKETT